METNLSKKLIHKNSIIRVVIIEKIEYILHYTHDNIEYSQLEDNEVDLGTLILCTKSYQPDKKLYEFTGKFNLKSKECLNEKIHNSNEYHFEKVINLLEGNIKMDNSTTMKLERIENNKAKQEYLFKIQNYIKGGIHFTIFKTVLEKNEVVDFIKIMKYNSFFFNLKAKIKKELEEELGNITKQSDDILNDLILTNNKYDIRYEKLLEKITEILNLKKRELIKLNENLTSEDKNTEKSEIILNRIDENEINEKQTLECTSDNDEIDFEYEATSEKRTFGLEDL